MAREPTAEELRAIAEHRGLKLLRSRKRTPGVGDFGKFGLTDTSGKPLLGIGREGLTASPAEIAQYLRGGAVSSWKLSAEREPAAAPKPKNRPAPQDEGEESIRRRGEPRASRPREPQARRQNPPPPPRSKPVLRIVDRVPEPAREVRLRPATGGDVKTLSRLLGQLAAPPRRNALGDNIAAIAKAGAGLIVAEQDTLIGCCAWAVVPTLQHGPIGRITLLLVDAEQRRRGVGTALLDAAEASLAKSGCRSIEIMSDIMINNAHNFFRSLEFEQTSYRFTRMINRRRIR